MPLVEGDSRSAWDPELLVDPRVSYFWDEGRISGRWFAEHVSEQEPLAWDAYFLYGVEAAWVDSPGPLVGAGYPIIDETDQLAADFTALLGQSD
jgi:hypothetical protein